MVLLVFYLKWVMSLKKNTRPVLLDTLAAMHVTCNMFFSIVLVSVSPIMISASKSLPF